jgi:hypothetical protein
MDVTVPEPNEALTAVLLSPTMRTIVEERANTAAMLYQATVAKRTGRLAASAHAHTEVGGKYHDRWTGELLVGAIGSLGTVDYAASHEFGTRPHPAAARDLNQVLAELEGI